MFKKIKSLLNNNSNTEATPERSLELAASALLVEAAVMDGNFDGDELNVISTLIRERFSLSPDEASELIDEATSEVENAVELYGFARTVKDNMEHDERVEIIEMLWKVVLADGHVDDFESNLIRRVAGLIYVSDRESGDARKRALDRGQ